MTLSPAWAAWKAAAAVRDGQTFMLNDGNGPKVYEFDSGPVILVGGTSNPNRGDLIAVTDNTQPNPTTVLIQFTDAAGTIDGVNKPAAGVVAINATLPNVSIAAAIVAAINGKGTLTAGSIYDPTTQQYCVSVGGDIALNITNNVNPLGVGLQTQGNFGVTAGNIRIPFLETESNLLFDQAIITAVQQYSPNINAGYATRTVYNSGVPASGDRLTFYGAKREFLPHGAHRGRRRARPQQRYPDHGDADRDALQWRHRYIHP